MLNIENSCIRKCCLNEDYICLGCFRTFDDMLKWHKASKHEKKEMLKKAQKRQEDHNK